MGERPLQQGAIDHVAPCHFNLGDAVAKRARKPVLDDARVEILIRGGGYLHFGAVESALLGLQKESLVFLASTIPRSASRLSAALTGVRDTPSISPSCCSRR